MAEPEIVDITVPHVPCIGRVEKNKYPPIALRLKLSRRYLRAIKPL